MFMEVFLEICDVMTGKLDSASSGHNTHTHLYLYLQLPSQNWLCDPHSACEPAEGNKTAVPLQFLAVGTPTLFMQLNGPLSGVGIILRQ